MDFIQLVKLAFFSIIAIVFVTLILLLIVSFLRAAVFGPTARPTASVASRCRNCGYDVRGGLQRCPECGRATQAALSQRFARLQNEWPQEPVPPRVPGTAEQLVCVLTIENGVAAGLLSKQLEARGIASEYAPDIDLELAIMSRVKAKFSLNVWSEDEVRAKAVIAELWPTDVDDIECT